MSHGEDQSVRQYLHDAHAADTTERLWLRGPQITAENLRDGSGPIERVTAKQWFALKDSTPAAGGARPARSGAGPLVFNWGNRHKGELAVDVREADPGYWRWSLTLDWWHAKVKAAGLLDDEEDAAA